MDGNSSGYKVNLENLWYRFEFTDYLLVQPQMGSEKLPRSCVSRTVGAYTNRKGVETSQHVQKAHCQACLGKGEVI